MEYSINTINRISYKIINSKILREKINKKKLKNNKVLLLKMKYSFYNIFKHFYLNTFHTIH